MYKGRQGFELPAEATGSQGIAKRLRINFLKIHLKSRVLIQRYPTPKRDLVRGQDTTSEPCTVVARIGENQTSN